MIVTRIEKLKNVRFMHTNMEKNYVVDALSIIGTGKEFKRLAWSQCYLVVLCLSTFFVGLYSIHTEI